ncbi:MAG: RsmE family RNA methyltransferase [Planctomycetota bacterium]
MLRAILRRHLIPSQRASNLWPGMRFFFLTTLPESETGPWHPSPELRRHFKALRFGPGEEFLLLPPTAGAIQAVFHSADRVELLGRAPRPSLPLLDVRLATAWPKGSRGDDLVRRCAESGVAQIIPLRCERSVVGRKDLGSSRQQRWQKILQEVCQQCGRPELPLLSPDPVDLDALPTLFPEHRIIALVPGTWPLGMELDLHRPEKVLLVIGPEGGFSPAEEARMRDLGFHFSGLVPTILRIEAAAPLAVGICQHHFLMRQGH